MTTVRPLQFTLLTAVAAMLCAVAQLSGIGSLAGAAYGGATHGQALQWPVAVATAQRTATPAVRLPQVVVTGQRRELAAADLRTVAASPAS